MDFIQINNKNQYQRELLIQFFDQLQTMKPFVKIITNSSFQSFTIFPVVKAKKQLGEYGPWIIEVAILKEFLFYSYRFFLPPYFLTYQKDFELEIKLQFIQSYSNESLQKIFYSHQILEQYKNNNNKKKAQFIEIQKLTPLLIGQSQVIHFYEQLF